MPSLGLDTVSTFGCPGADKIALNIGQAAEYRQHQAPGAGARVGSRFHPGSELALASTMRLTMLNRSKVLRASRSIRVTVTSSPSSRCSSIRRSSRGSARAVSPAPVNIDLTCVLTRTPFKLRWIKSLKICRAGARANVA